MRKIDIKEPNTIEWKKWRKKCEEETESLIKIMEKGANEPWKKKDLYKGQKKKFYFKKDKPFYGRCAYCETQLGDFDDLDHYRPAKGVTDMNHKVIDHPGYYWLTYDWLNLLPSCKDCNSKKILDGETIGKGSRFPLAVESNRAKSKGEEKKERPLLFNPTIDKPDEHFEYDFKFSKIFSKENSEKGKMTIKILGFHKREQLWEDWKNAYDGIFAKWGRTYSQEDKNKGKSMRMSLYKKISSGECGFSFVKQKAMEQILNENAALKSEICIE